MDGSRLNKIDLLTLMKTLGTVGYTWDLERDLIDWRAPLNLLLSPEAPFKSGSSYNNCLSTQSFYKRMQALSSLRPITNEYQCSYALTLPSYEYCPVRDEGEVLFNKEGHPYKLQGTLTFLEEASSQLSHHHYGYDSLTGLPEKELVQETLSCFLDQSTLNQQGGAYIALTVDQLAQVACHYGVNTSQKIIQKVGEALRETIRFDDFIGRTSGCGFGLILKDCDHWGLIRAYHRIAEAIHNIHLYDHDALIEVPVSIGGIIFPRKDFTPAKVMQRAERYLFESQENVDLRTSYDTAQVSSHFKRPLGTRKGSLRHTDDKALRA